MICKYVREYINNHNNHGSEELGKPVDIWRGLGRKV